jgi:hypothetical protein
MLGRHELARGVYAFQDCHSLHRISIQRMPAAQTWDAKTPGGWLFAT